MKPALSICIPTLDRPAFLLQALRSIFLNNEVLDLLEICISNNASKADYASVERLLDDHAHRCKIRYVRHAERLPLDANHHFAKRLATSNYVFFLGDDDYFLRDDLPKLLQWIEQVRPNLAIFNGLKVDAANAYLGTLFALPSREYGEIDAAFTDLWDKGSFGAVLVRTELLDDADFEQLYGTDHAYGCYWLSLFRLHEHGEPLRISVPDFACVAVRCAQKTYDHLNVYYKTIPYEFAVRRRLVESKELRELIERQAVSFEKFQSSFRFLSHLRSSGHDLEAIRRLNPEFYGKHRRVIRLAQAVAGSALFGRIRSKLLRSIRQSASNRATREIAYKLSSAHAMAASVADTA